MSARIVGRYAEFSDCVWDVIYYDHPDHIAHDGWTYQRGQDVVCACGTRLMRIDELKPSGEYL